MYFLNLKENEYKAQMFFKYKLEKRTQQQRFHSVAPLGLKYVKSIQYAFPGGEPRVGTGRDGPGRLSCVLESKNEGKLAQEAVVLMPGCSCFNLRHGVKCSRQVKAELILISFS